MLSTVVLTFIVLTANKLCTATGDIRSDEPTDTVLKGNLYKNLSAFVSLRDLVMKSKITYLAPGRIENYYLEKSQWFLNNTPVAFEKVTLDTGITIGQWRDSERLMAEAKIQSVKTSKPGQIKFLVWRSSPEPKPALEEKYIVFCKYPSSKQSADTTVGRPILDKDLSADRQRLELFSSIDDHWFVMFVRTGNIPPPLPSPLI